MAPVISQNDQQYAQQQPAYPQQQGYQQQAYPQDQGHQQGQQGQQPSYAPQQQAPQQQGPPQQGQNDPYHRQSRRMMLGPTGTGANPAADAVIVPPARAPGPGEVIVGYEYVQPETGCCACDGLTQEGLVAVIILLIVFPCAACIPCCSASCHERQQRPVYGPQGSNQNQGNYPQHGPNNYNNYPQQQTGYPVTNQNGKVV
ncbi:hypothetical protein WJX73_003115 [Symbiochloris irregularis]|uniref:Uncharacterized protein n=1 Tax=Symbiochloris irregularis TaxID=706552 RepID=A0AAW1PNG6_9CHLO